MRTWESYSVFPLAYLCLVSMQDRRIAVLLGLLTGSVLGVLCFFTEDWLIRYPFTDDAFYYAQIARNIVSGKGVTFDGLHETNGFHPLWLLLLLPIYALFSGDWLPLRVILGLQALLAAASSVLLYAVLRRWTGRLLAILGVVLYQMLTFLLEISFSGMETGLQGLLLIYLLWKWPAIAQNLEKKAWFLGILLGLIILARLDGVAVAGIVGLYTLWRLRKASPSRIGGFLARLGIAAGLVTGPYFVWNLLHFGHLMPVSGAAKRYPLWEKPLAETLNKLFWWAKALSKGLSYAGIGNIPPWLLGSLTLLIVALLLFYLKWWKNLLQTPELLLGMGAGAAHYVLSSLTLITFRGWYLVTEVLAIVLFLSYLWERHKILKVIGIAMYGGLFATIGKLTKDWRLSPETNAVIYEAYQVGLWLRENTPPQSRCATWDAGVIGYFAHRPVINLDGLVNTYDFLPLLKSKLLPTYLKEKNVRYLTTYTLGTDYKDYWHFKEHWDVWESLLQKPVYIKPFFHKPADVFFDASGGESYYYIWELPAPTADPGKP